MEDEWGDMQFLSHFATRNKYNYRPKFSQLNDMPDIQFRREFRMSKATFRKLNIIVSPLITGSDCDPDEYSVAEGRTMPKYKKLLVALKFFASGNFHYDTGTCESYSASQVCITVREVAAAIAGLFHQYVKRPTEAERTRVRRQVMEEREGERKAFC